MSNIIRLRPFEQWRLKSLIELARNRFDDSLTQAEANVLMHSTAAYELSQPPVEQTRPPVRSEFLRWLMTDADAAKFIDPKGIRIWAVTLREPLDLQGCIVSRPLHFLWCTVEAEIAMFTAQVQGLYVFGCSLEKGLLADGITVQGPIFILGAISSGPIRLVGADIGRNIDMTGTELRGSGLSLALDGARVRGSAFFHNGFKATGEIRLLNSRIGGDLGFNGAALTSLNRALSLDKVTVDGNVSLSTWVTPEGNETPFSCDGSVNLLSAQINGDLDCKGARLLGKGTSLNLTTAQVRGHVYLRDGFRACGQLLMHSLHVANSVDLSGAVLTEAEIAVALQEAVIRGTLSICDGFKSFGRVDAQSAQIDGNLVCDDCALPFFYCANLKLQGDLQWTGIHAPLTTGLCLNGATIKNIRDERESWPGQGRLFLDGLSYGELTLHSQRTAINKQKTELGPEHALDVNDRVAWLRLQPNADRAEPQPWMQLASLLRSKGDEDSAKKVIFQMRRAQAESSSNVSRLWKILFAHLQQNPLWVLVPILLTTALGTCLFGLASTRGAMAPTSKDAYSAWAKGARMDAAYPRFNSFVYSLENDLPLVKFGLDDKWAPDPTYHAIDAVVSYDSLRWSRVFLILFGWLQATVLAAAIGSRFKS